MTRKPIFASLLVAVATLANLIAPAAQALPDFPFQIPQSFKAPSLNLWGEEKSAPERIPSKPDTQKNSTSRAKVTPKTTTIPAQLEAIVNSIRSEYGGSVAVSISNGIKTYTAGDDLLWSTWSTVKVPLAIAALRKNPKLQTQARLSITASDNQATDVLWNSLGAGAQAAQEVTKVIQEAQATANVNTWHWGSSTMKPSQQAKFGARLTCLPRATKVRSLMGHIIPEQSYGLGRMKNTIFKGGWGPSGNTYIIRQFGSVTVPGGTVGVAFYLQPNVATYGTTQQAANKVADRLAQLTTQIKPSVC